MVRQNVTNMKHFDRGFLSAWELHEASGPRWSEPDVGIDPVDPRPKQTIQMLRYIELRRGAYWFCGSPVLRASSKGLQQVCIAIQ